MGNDDGQPHSYGWEINLVTKKVDYYFDRIVVGFSREANFTTANGDEHQFGDATGGDTHRDIYESFSIREDIFLPDPASLALVGCGGMALVMRRRKA